MTTGKKEWGEETIALHSGYSPVPMERCFGHLCHLS